jgi:hypothetical protein
MRKDDKETARVLAKKGIGFEAADNGILSCEDPKRLPALCQTLTPQKIDALLRKWLKRLPHPFTLKDRQAGARVLRLETAPETRRVREDR